MRCEMRHCGAFVALVVPYIVLALCAPHIEAAPMAARNLRAGGRREVLQQAPSIPASPYVDPKVCFTDGQSVDVQGFPSSPFLPNVFDAVNNKFKNPDYAVAIDSKCDDFGNCMDAYAYDIKQVDVDLHTGCTAGKTTLMGYNGQVPGPTFNQQTGRQALVRFTNQVPADSTVYPAYDPCNSTTRTGRPFSVHCHGMASLAPWDGWAEDEICNGEYKNYVYPSNEAGTKWYHDHALDITGDNAYAGLAGLYLIRDKPDRWGLDNMEEYHMILADKVFKADCQQLYDTEGAHQNNLYGDINFVSGIPFPVVQAEPKWVRFRMLNAAVSRPYLLVIKDAKTLNTVSDGVCQMIASDGGYRRSPVPFPKNGLFMGVAERYEFVCNFAALPAGDYILWNLYDEARTKDVPYFCYSHLVAKITIGTTCTTKGVKDDCHNAPVFNPAGMTYETSVDKVISQADQATALSMANDGVCSRNFEFGRGGGQWVINGETWFTNRVAARDVGMNTWEVWCFQTGGGWFHPIHIHLIDFYIIKRYEAGDYQILESYEKDAAKDVVQMFNGAHVAMLARFGAHRGEYMFHCHNLRHEDNAMLRSFRNNATANTRPQELKAVDQPFIQITQLSTDGHSATSVLYDQYQDPNFADAAHHTALGAPDITTDLAVLLSKAPYRMFYPAADDRSLLCDSSINKWLVFSCCSGALAPVGPTCTPRV